MYVDLATYEHCSLVLALRMVTQVCIHECERTTVDPARDTMADTIRQSTVGFGHLPLCKRMTVCSFTKCSARFERSTTPRRLNIDVPSLIDLISRPRPEMADRL